MKKLLKKYGWELLGAAIAAVAYAVESKKAASENDKMKKELKDELLKELRKDMENEK